MKAFLSVQLAIALVTTFVSAAVDTRHMKDYVSASRDSWRMTYDVIAGVHYDYMGRVEIATMSYPGLPGYGEHCYLQKYGQAYEEALEEKRDAQWKYSATWNPNAVSEAKHGQATATTKANRAKKTYDAKIACDEKVFAAFKKKNERGGLKHWVFFLSEERRRWKAYGAQSKFTWSSGVYGDACGTWQLWKDWNNTQYLSNWATFNRDRFESPSSQGPAGQNAYKKYTENQATWTKYLAAKNCDQIKSRNNQATEKEMISWKNHDLGVVQGMFKQAAAAKKRSNDVCSLQAFAVVYVQALETARMNTYLDKLSNTAAYHAHYKALTVVDWKDYNVANGYWVKALQCDKIDVAKRAAKAAAVKEMNRLKAIARKHYMSSLRRNAEENAKKQYWGGRIRKACVGTPRSKWSSYIKGCCRKPNGMYYKNYNKDIKRYMRSHKNDFDRKRRLLDWF